MTLFRLNLGGLRLVGVQSSVAESAKRAARREREVGLRQSNTAQAS